ncbi:Clavaminate synthase-like protein [Wolfiporia cocos MD-104 SS10]|uniref:JmjC domain-containing histone demethylation protein 1 n=1 Tax=Wolfiporia cocos (strain MD-104) TaxID=742152 RepID=A0A2H3J990_WOLCO|nr:Clavaminate synthase-like protein [Wolfiporia cocos MD-104 SS10]
MARARRRSTKKSADEANVKEEHEPDASQEQEQEEENCPACKPGGTEEWAAADKENWVRCDACKTWYHWRCAGDGSDLDAVDKWYCKACMAQDPARVITMKPPARKSARKRQQRDYAGLHNMGAEAAPDRWMRMLQGKRIAGDPFRRMNGVDVSIEWVESDDAAMREPVVIESPEGLGMKMPPRGFTVRDVAEIIGENSPLEVIDVATQSNVPNWTLGKWAEYYDLEPSARDKVRNVISLEISGTDLADKVLPPRLVRDLDWVERYWPITKKGKGHAYPKVQLYCLMGVAGAWTDWHIDFAGSSVYYHILHGAKVFYFIRPTPANLAAYEKWSGTDMQNHSWLGDMVDEVYKVELHDGNTMIIPTGWIHAVYTPVDTLVFGGNFLHSYNVPVQLKVREIEIATHVPKKFRYPYFVKLCWYAAEKYLRDLKSKEEFSTRVLESVEALAEFLVNEARTMERGTEHQKREAKEQVPSDRIKDAPALARELRWRVRLASGYTSDDDVRSHRRLVRSGSGTNAGEAAGSKRKRAEGDDSAMFRNFQPQRRVWTRVVEAPAEGESRVIRARKPADGEGRTDWMEQWTVWREELEGEEGEGTEEVVVERRRDVVLKVRRTEKGIERQRVERVLEEWVWTGGGDEMAVSSPAAPPEPVSAETSSKEEAMVDKPAKEEDTKDSAARKDVAQDMVARDDVAMDTSHDPDAEQSAKQDSGLSVTTRSGEEKAAAATAPTAAEEGGATMDVDAAQEDGRATQTDIPVAT